MTWRQRARWHCDQGFEFPPNTKIKQQKWTMQLNDKQNFH